MVFKKNFYGNKAYGFMQKIMINFLGKKMRFFDKEEHFY